MTAKQQIGLHQTFDQAADREYWGHRLREEVPPNTLRFVSLNHGGFPVQPKELKTRQLQQYLLKVKCDIVGLTENNVHWKLLPIEHRLEERTRGWWETLHMSNAYFANYPTKFPLQYGGVSLWSINRAAHKVTSKGQDPRGLGRWAWTRYNARAGVTL